MSLTSILETPQARAFLKPIIRSPAMKPEKMIKAPPLLKDASRLGVAFDYGFRFGLDARSLGKADKSVAATGLKKLPALVDDPVLLRSAREQFDQAMSVLTRLSPQSTLDDAAAEALIRLASLDYIFRCRRLEYLQLPTRSEELADLKALYALIPWAQFEGKQRVLLNPTFGEGSGLVGGADADIVVDDCVIEIKTVKDISVELAFVRQLVGYALLANEYGITTLSQLYPGRITRLAVYFSRTGQLFSFPLSEVIHPSDWRKVLDYFRQQGGLV